jgi:hypothetical protein
VVSTSVHSWLKLKHCKKAFTCCLCSFCCYKSTNYGSSLFGDGRIVLVHYSMIFLKLCTGHPPTEWERGKLLGVTYAWLFKPCGCLFTKRQENLMLSTTCNGGTQCLHVDIEVTCTAVSDMPLSFHFVRPAPFLRFSPAEMLIGKLKPNSQRKDSRKLVFFSVFILRHYAKTSFRRS